MGIVGYRPECPVNGLWIAIPVDRDVGQVVQPAFGGA
jgi:hypothetical protein